MREGSQNEVAMGYKTGQHNSLVGPSDRESKIILPSPEAPPSTQGPLVSIRSVTVGYYSGIPPPLLSVSVPVPAPAPTPISASSPNVFTSISTSANQKKSSSNEKGTGLAIGLPKKRAKPKEVEGELWEGYSEEFMTMIIKDMHLDIIQGGKIAILGSNGSGKSTLIRLLINAEPGSTTGGVIGKNLHPESMTSITKNQDKDIKRWP